MIADYYDWAGGREAMLRFGPADGPVIVAALPLFEEANRARAFVVTILRALADRGIASALPDLPGQGESLTALESVSILKMQEAYSSAVDTFDREGRNCYGIAIRSGALLDALGLLYGRWHLAPTGGPQLLRELTRMKQAELGSRYRLGENWWFGDMFADGPVVVAGNPLSQDLLTELTVKEPFKADLAPEIPLRTVRLETDPKPADAKLAGSPLWRRAEPDNDADFAARVADDIAVWIATCAG